MTPTTIVVVVLVDIVVTVALLAFVLARRGGIAGALGQIRQFAAVAGDLEREVTEYLDANWSGDPDVLPQVLEPLLAKLEADLEARGMKAGRAQLKPLVGQVILRRGNVRASDVREALKRVA